MWKYAVNYKAEQSVGYFYNLGYISNSRILCFQCFFLGIQKNVFLSSSFSKDSFTEYKILGWHLFSFWTLKILFWLPVLLLRNLLQINFHLFEVFYLVSLLTSSFLSLMLCSFISMNLGLLFFFFLLYLYLDSLKQKIDI